MEITLSILEGSYDLAQTLVITQISVFEKEAPCDVLLVSFTCGLGSWIGILCWLLVKRSRTFLWQVVITCFCVWVVVGVRSAWQSCWQENGERPASASWELLRAINLRLF